MTVAEFQVRHALGSYPVTVRPGVFDELPARARALWPDRPVALVVDDTVRTLLGARVEPAAWEVVLSVPSGEASKSRERWAALTDALSSAGLTRHSALVAVGGGVVGDLAGFVAATFARGIPHLLVPTTLLAMVDSSVGGKTGVDTPHGKNLVGAFHPPAAVLADPLLLQSVPTLHLRGGLAEMAKHGLVADQAYWEEIGRSADALQAREPAALTRLIARSVAIKADIVTRDEREAGPRAILNAGHTVAHAVEQATRYEVPHGDAVAMGLVAETLLAEVLGAATAGLSARVSAGLRGLGLPTRLPAALDAHALLGAMRLDKKRGTHTLRFALVSDIGTPAREGSSWTIAVPDEEKILHALRGSGAA